jgi:hypothetical protein
MSAYAAEFKIIIQIKILVAIDKWNFFNMLKQEQAYTYLIITSTCKYMKI